MKIITITALYCGLVIMFSQFSLAQAPISKKRTHEFHLTGLTNIPLLSGAFSQNNYLERNNELIARKDLFDFGANMRYSFQTSPRTRLGLDVTMRQIEVFTDRTYESQFASSFLGTFTQSTDYRVQSVSIPHWTIQPILVYSSPSSINGSGFENTFGLGLTIFEVQRKSYAYSLTDFPENESSWTQVDYYYLDHNWSKNYAITAQYGLSLSIPISSAFSIKIGTTIFLNIYFVPEFENTEAYELGLFDLEKIIFNVQRENFISWNLQSGISYRF